MTLFRVQQPWSWKQPPGVGWRWGRLLARILGRGGRGGAARTLNSDPISIPKIHFSCQAEGKTAYILDNADKCLSKCLLVLAFWCGFLPSAVPSWQLFGTTWSTHVYCLAPVPQFRSWMSCSSSEELVASRASRNCGYWCVFEEERSVKQWATFYLICIISCTLCIH